MPSALLCFLSALIPPLWVRLAWFAGLAMMGCVTTAAVAYLLKALLR